MSRKIRIGKDITLRWRVLTDFEPKPLSGRNLLLYLTDPFGLVIPLDFAVTNNNLISATYPGKDQVKLGRYILTLAENKGLDWSTAIDVIDAFTLVARTAYEGGSTGCHNLTLETIDLEGNLVTGGRGMSAYEVWLSQGHVGSEADFLLSLIGKDGISIVKIEQIETSSESSGVNRIRITLSNGTSEDFIVRNGAKGDKMTYEDLTEADKEDIYEGGAEILKPLFATKQNKLMAGKGISIDGDVISCTLNIDIFRIVNALPSVGEANLIYLVPAEQPSESDLFEEWVWTDKWERIGSAKIDLSNYATKTELATKQDILTAGEGIDIEGNVISSTGGGGGIYPSEMNSDFNDDFAN